MSAPSTAWTESDTARACQIWADYQRANDVSAQNGQAVGIDPASGRVWLGESAKDIVLRLEAQGFRTPLFFLRVGQDFYARKGGRRSFLAINFPNRTASLEKSACGAERVPIGTGTNALNRLSEAL